jgi:hypothetical protein
MRMAIRVTPNTKKRKRGGQYKHCAEEVRVWVWYYEIRRRCDWSDYALDKEFAWTELGMAERADDADRPRTFEWIRKKARKPAGKDARWRSMNDLVAAINLHPLFLGTQALYLAEFWDIVQKITIPSKTVQSDIEKLLGASGLIRVNPDEVAVISVIIRKYGHASVFDRCLRLSLKKMDSLTGLTLIWLLYLQAEAAHNWSTRAVVKSIADEHLDNFFEHHLPDNISLDYYTDFIELFESVRLDSSDRQISGHGYLEMIVNWPIIPKELLHTVCEADLFGFL